MAVHRQRGAAERAARRDPRVGGRQTPPPEIIFEQRRMRRDLAREILVVSVQAERVGQTVNQAPERHSHRNATSGSTPAARRAGRYAASVDTAANTSATAPKVAGS